MNDVKMKPKLISLFLLAGIIPLIVVGWWSSQKATNALMQSSFNQLEGVRGIKKGQIEQFFAEREGDMGVLTETVDALRHEAFSKLEAVLENKKVALELLSSQWFADVKAQQDRSINTKGMKHYQAFLNTGEKSLEYDRFASIIDGFVKETIYFDYFVIDENGLVVHSQGKEADYKTDLVNGPYKETGLAEAYENAIKGDITLVDFAPYAPNNNEPAAFIAAPIIAGGEVTGVVALQISMEKILLIMNERSGLGKTGEVYLVGPDKLMRSDSFLDPEHYTVKASFANPDKGSVDTDAVKNAFAGKDGASVILDHNGNPVLAAYSTVKIGDITWAIIAEIDVAEAFRNCYEINYTI